MQIDFTSTTYFFQQFILYSYFDVFNNRPAIKLGCSSSGVSKFQAAYINFNENFIGCPSNNYFLTYFQPFTTIALQCKTCEKTC